MKEFFKPDSSIHIIVRGIIVQGDSMYICRPVGAKWCFLPGGHVENGESAIESLQRELSEEFEDFQYGAPVFAGICESVFEMSDNLMQHEINIVYYVSVTSLHDLRCKESHIEVEKILIAELKDTKMRPSALRDSVIAYLETGQAFMCTDK